MTSQIRAKTFDQLEKRGRKLYADLLQNIDENGTTFKPLPQLPTSYSTERRGPETLGLSELLKQNLASSGVSNRDWVMYSVSSHKDNRFEPCYQNYIHASGRSIVCVNNYASRDTLRGTPGCLFWSDHIAIGYFDVVTNTTRDGFIPFDGSTKNLETVWRVLIQNRDTHTVIQEIQARHQGEEQPLLIDNTDDGFYALLGSDNGKGIARMLASYPQMFGRKTISQVQIWSTELCWFLQTVPAPPAPPIDPAPLETAVLSRSQRRRLKKDLKKSRCSEG